MAWVLMAMVVCATAIFIVENSTELSASEFVLRTLVIFAILWVIVGAYRWVRARRK